MKKKLPLMIVLIMLLQIIMPITTIIWESKFTVNSIGATTLEATDSNGITWTYELEDNKAINVKPKDKNSLPTEVTIPEKLDGYSVTSIESWAFEECTSLTSVAIPNSVTSIGDGAFFDCTSLISIEIPDSVTSIEYATFWKCVSLTSIDIPDSVTSIRQNAFYNCSSLTNVKIPDSVTSIGANSFGDCTSLTSIEIPDSVTSIINSAFEYCTSLTSINVNSNNKNYTSENGVLFNKGKTEIICYPAGKTDTKYVIPSSVTSIGDSAFSGCTSLTSINIPDGVKSIRDHTFYKCTSLTSINIPDSVTSIGSYSFYGCTSLTSIEIPDSVTSIEYYVFRGCKNLKNLTIPCTINNIGSGVFEGVPGPVNYYKNNETMVNYVKEYPEETEYRIIEVTEITVTTAPSKTNYVAGQNFSSTGMKVTAKYNDGSTKEVTNYTVTDGNNLTIGKTSVTISYTENGITKTTTQKITVVAKEITEITVTTAPSKTNYVAGQNFSSTGMKVTAKCNDGSTKEVTNYTITDGNNLTAGKTSVTISYTENGITKTTTQNITVIREITEITVTTAPSKTNYVAGQNFSSTGMKVTAKYNDGSTKEVTNYTVTDGNNLTAGKTSVTISYTENGVTKTTAQKITVVVKEITGITVTTAPSKTNYVAGQNFSSTGMKVTAKYNDGSTKEVTNYTITDGNNLTAGKTSVTISYTENGVTKTTAQKITVVIKGDANGDGKINFSDILTINKHRLGKAELTGAKLFAADVNNDGVVDFKDMLKINKYRLGKIDTL